MGAAEEDMVIKSSREMMPAYQKLTGDKEPDINEVFELKSLPTQSVESLGKDGAVEVKTETSSGLETESSEKLRADDKLPKDSSSIGGNGGKKDDGQKNLLPNSVSGMGKKEEIVTEARQKKELHVDGNKLGRTATSDGTSERQVPIPVITGVGTATDPSCDPETSQRRTAVSEYDPNEGGRFSRRFIPPGMPRQSRSYHGSTGQLRLTRRSTGNQYHNDYNTQPAGSDWQGSQRGDQEFGFRFVMPKAFVSQFIGSKGLNIKGMIARSMVKSIYVDKDNSAAEMQAVNVIGNPPNCEMACEEIMKFLYHQITGRIPDSSSHVRLELLIEDIYCGLLIGRHGRAMHELREGTSTRITVSKLLYDEKFISFYPERVMFISGSISNVVQAQAEVSRRQYAIRTRQRDNVFFQSTGARRQVYTGPAMLGHLICDIYINNAQAGAVIGRNGDHIKQVMNMSQALVSVMPKRDDDRPGRGERRVRIAGTHEALFRASYGVLLHIIRYLPSRPSVEGYDLDIELLIPAAAVGHIIGKRGRRVRQMESRTGAFIHIGNCSQCSPAPSGAGRTRVGIRGNFWQAQKAVSLIWDVVQGIEQHDSTNYQRGAALRRASVPNLRELRYSQTGPDQAAEPQGVNNTSQPASQRSGSEVRNTEEIVSKQEASEKLEKTSDGNLLDVASVVCAEQSSDWKNGEGCDGDRKVLRLDEIVSLLKAKVESTEELYTSGKLQKDDVGKLEKKENSSAVEVRPEAPSLRNVEQGRSGEQAESETSVSQPAGPELPTTSSNEHRETTTGSGKEAGDMLSVPAQDVGFDDTDKIRKSVELGGTEEGTPADLPGESQPTAEKIDLESEALASGTVETNSQVEPSRKVAGDEHDGAVLSCKCDKTDPDLSSVEVVSSDAANNQAGCETEMSSDIKLQNLQTQVITGEPGNADVKAVAEKAETEGENADSEEKAAKDDVNNNRREAEEEPLEPNAGQDQVGVDIKAYMLSTETENQMKIENEKEISSDKIVDVPLVTETLAADGNLSTITGNPDLVSHGEGFSETGKDQIKDDRAVAVIRTELQKESLPTGTDSGSAGSHEEVRSSRSGSLTEPHLDSEVAGSGGGKSKKSASKPKMLLPLTNPKKHKKGKGDEGRRQRGSVSGSQSSGAPSPRTPTAPVEVGGVSASEVARALKTARRDSLSKNPQAQ